MAEIPSHADLYAAVKAEIQSRNPALTDFEEGSVLDAFTGASVVLADEVARVLVDLFSDQFFATARGSALVDLAQDRLGITPQQAGRSSATLTWTRVAAGTYTIPAGTSFAAVNPDGGEVSFSSFTDVVVGPGDTSVPVVVVADEAGRSSNVDVGTITTILDSVAADFAATVTNEGRAAGGSPAWTDAQFLAYIKDYYSSLRRGTLPAIRTGALSVAGVSVVVVRVREGGIIEVYVGDPDGAGNQILADAVALELENWRPVTALVQVFPSTREELSVSLQVTLTSLPADTSQMLTDIRSAVVAYGDTLAAGDIAYATELIYAVKSVDEDRVLSVTGATDLAPSADTNAIRFVGGSVSVTFIGEG